MTKKPYEKPELKKLNGPLFALTGESMDDATFPVTGFSNPVLAMKALVDADRNLTADEESFKAVAEIVGDAPPEVLANGFICDNFSEAMPRLASIANIRVIGNAGTISVELLPDDPRARQ